MDYAILKMDKKGQGTLEMTFVLITAVLLLGGILNIWLWENKQAVKRQVEYNRTRRAAGTSYDSYKLNDNDPEHPERYHPWPVYSPEELKEDKVLLDAP